MTAVAALSAFGGAGCVAKVDPVRGGALALAPTTLPGTRPVSALVWDSEVESRVCPPPGWTLDPVKRSDTHVHKTWLSPSRNTAYGLIRIRLPVPLTEEMMLWGFLQEMKRSEGQAVLLGKQFDKSIDALRFEAEGGQYYIRTTLRTSGRTAYCVYAGTLRQNPIDELELQEAIAAREATRTGPPPPTEAPQ